MRGAFFVPAVAVCTVLAAAARPAHALDPAKRLTQYMHRSWGTQEGLPQNTVLSMMQAEDGYLWLATQEGLARFDGVTFTQFNSRNTPCLANHWIVHMAPMPDGSAWLLPFHGNPVRLAAGVFHCDPLPAGLPGESLISIAPAADGGTWFASAEGLFLVHGERITRVYRGAPHDQLSSIRIRRLTLARDGALWIATDGGGVSRIDRAGAIEVFDASRGLSSDEVADVVEARDGTIWTATSRGVDVISQGRIANVAGVPNAPFRTLLQDSRGAMWIGTDRGLVRLHGGAVSTMGHADGLAGPIVGSIFEDREGNLWVGTFMGEDRGVARLSDGPFTPYGMAEGMRNGQVWSVLEEVPGRIWIGTESGGLTRLEKGLLTTFGRESALGDDSVRSLYRSRDGTLWIGTYRVGTKRFDGTSFEAVPSSDHRCDSNVVAIAEDGEGALWIATKGLLDDRVGVLCRLDQGAFRVVDLGPKWKEDFFACMFRTRDGRLLVCSASGLHFIRGGEVTTFTTRDGLSSDFLLAAHEEPDGTIWIGTGGGGVNRLKNGELHQVRAADGLFDDTVSGIVEDGLGNLWLSGNRGIFRVSKRQLNALFEGRLASIESVVYGLDDGMRSAECNGGSQYPVVRGADGHLWFATMKGAVTVDPRHLTTSHHRPEVIIEKVSADGRDLDLAPGLTLEPGTRTLDFRYTATSLTASERIRFKYRLDGFDSDWVDADDRRTAYYTNLPPGAYRFRVIAANKDGLWNEAGASVRFYLEPAFHQTWWFSASCLVAALSLVLSFPWVRVRQMRRREKALQLRVVERTRQIAEAENYSRAIVSNVGEGIVTFDEGRRISRWNAAAERIFGFTAEEAVGQTAALLNLGDAAGVDTAARPAVVEEARRKDGAVIPIEIHATEAHIDEKSMTIWLVRDLTETRQAEAKVASMQRELIATSRRAGMAQIATSVLHNVGNAITSVSISAGLVSATLRCSRSAGLSRVVAMLPADSGELASFLTATEKGRQLPTYLAKLSEAIERERSTAMDELQSMENGIERINAILSAQQSHARVAGVDEALKLSELIDDAIGFERSLCEMARVTVRREYAAMPLVRVDRQRLLEIVMNLLINAREAVTDPAAGGRRNIAVTTRLVDGGYFAIEVHDSGIGIAPENLVKIFNQGFTTKPTGTGFGLHGCSCAAIELGGRLSAESDGPGKGAAFILTLPMERSADAPRGAVADSQAQVRSPGAAAV
jgi:PAS domain S-box-containing protein